MMRTGKDSVAKLLIEEFGYQRISFADPLRKMAADVDPYISLEGAPDDVVEALFAVTGSSIMARYTVILEVVGYERAKEIPDFRRFLQRLGTEGVRDNFGQDSWVNKFIANVQGAGPEAKFVVPDVRFPNEAQTIKDLSGVVWRTERPGYDGGDNPDHPSEANVLKITPDVILRADSLLDWEEKLEDEKGNPYVQLHVGLGTLTIQQLGLNPESYRQVLADWADAVLNG
jgi:deoxynucleotide monophosphate kinase-like protein